MSGNSSSSTFHHFIILSYYNYQKFRNSKFQKFKKWTLKVSEISKFLSFRFLRKIFPIFSMMFPDVFATSTSKGGSHVNVLTSNLRQKVPTRPKAQKTETCTLNSMAMRARPSGHHAEAEIDPDPSQGPHSAQNGHKPKGLPRWPLAASPSQGRPSKHPRTAGEGCSWP